MTLFKEQWQNHNIFLHFHVRIQFCETLFHMQWLVYFYTIPSYFLGMKRTMQSKWKDEMHHAKSNKKLKFFSVSDKFLHIQCEIKLKKNRRYTFELRILLAWFGFACQNPDAPFIRTNYFAFVQSDQIAYNCNLKSVHSAWDKWNL